MKSGLERRVLLKAALACGLSLGADAQSDGALLPPQPGDQLVRLGDAGKTPLAPGDIVLSAIQTAAWAMDPASGTLRSGTRLNQVLLLRLDPQTLASTTRARAADGVVAYTAICTHNGCDVDDWIAKEHVLSCSCHESQFDPRDAAKVVDGPAPRALPALPLKIVNGRLAVAAPFTDRVGFEKG
jgi:Rieske Fe-S protein